MSKESTDTGKSIIAIFPYFFLGKKQVGYSCGWYIPGIEDGYVMQFGNFVSQEVAIKAIQETHPDSEILLLDYMPRTRQNPKRIYLETELTPEESKATDMLIKTLIKIDKLENNEPTK